MLPPTCPQNVDGASPDTTEHTSSNIRWTPHTASPSTLFRSDSLLSGPSNSFNRSDQPPPDSEKTDEELVGKFLWHGICRHMGIKDFLPEQASFCEYTWEVVACMMITGKRYSGLDIWPETLNQDTGTKDMILTTWYKKAMT